MTAIRVYEKNYHLMISGGDHWYARVDIYKVDGKPAISNQKADALVRAYNPNLRINDREVITSGVGFRGTVIGWIRLYIDPILIAEREADRELMKTLDMKDEL